MATQTILKYRLTNLLLDPPLAPGQKYLVDSQGRFIVDSQGNKIVTTT